ncbi:MAG: tetratricopeptide repeat protein [Promethearchaeota archaeon]
MGFDLEFKEYEEDINSLFPPEYGYTFLVGAGISMDSPTNMPSATEIVKSLLELCAPLEEVEKLFSLEMLRFELVVEKIQDEFDEELRFLDYLDNITEPNIIHYFLGNAITRGNYVVTTNFDYMIERALMRILDKKWHQDIIPVITKEDYVFYQDPKNLIKAGKCLLYKIHGSKRNIITGLSTKHSLITTISALGREREEGETFAIEPFKKSAIYNLMKDRTLIVMGYSGSDDFDIEPTLKELPFLKRLIWIEHTQKHQIDIIWIRKENFQKDEQEISHLEKMLLEISISGDFEVLLIRTNTKNFIKTKLWEIFLPYIPLHELDVLESKTETQMFSEWIKPIYENIPQVYKYRLAIQLYFYLKKLEATLDCSEKGLRLAEESNDLNSKSYFLNFLGLVNQITGNYEKSINYYEEALQIDENAKDLSGKATDLGNIGSIHLTRGNYKLALDHYNEALEIANKLGDLSGKVANLNNIGRINEIRGELQIALNNYEEALKFTEKLGDLDGKATVLNNIGMIHGNQQEYNLALEKYNEALKIVENLGDLYGKIIITNNIGRVYDEFNDYDKALEKYEESIGIAEQLGDLSKKAGCLNNIGSIYLAQGNYNKALEKYQDALKIEDRLGNPLMKVIYLNNIGMIYNTQTEYKLALASYSKALQIIETLGDLSKKALLLTKVGSINMIQEDYQIALKNYEEAILIFGEIGELSNKAASLSNVGKIYEKLVNHHKALEVYEEALQIDDQIGDTMGKASDLYNLGRVYETHGEMRKALLHYENSITLFTQLNQTQYKNVIQQKIDELKRKIGK